MLTKTDLRQIDQLMKKRLAEFFESLILPYFEHNEKEHKEMRKEFREGVTEIGEYIKDHEKRISKLETLQKVN